MFEVEGELSCRNSEFKFMNRAVPLFCTENFSIKPKQKGLVKLMDSLTIAKINHGNSVITIKLKLKNNTGVINIIKMSNKTMHFTKDKAIGIVYIRSLGYYTIKHCTLEYNLNKNHIFANFNKMATTYEDLRLAKAKWKAKEKMQASNTEYIRSISLIS